MKAISLLAVFIASFLTGCATNPVAQFYQDYTKQMSVAFKQRILPPSGDPQFVAVAEAEYKTKVHQYEEQGYVLVGGAAFQGPAITQSQLIEQAKAVGADIVFFSSELSGTQQGVRPIITYQPGQTYNTSEFGTVNANAYGSGGYASGFGTYSGSSTTTSSGTYNTQYVPYQYSVYRTSTAFWRKLKPFVFGTRFNPIPDDLRAALQRNTGAYVSAVIQDSPAFKANILDGDLIIQIADKPVANPQELSDYYVAHAGQKVTIKLIRNGQTLDVDVQLNERQ